MPISDKALLDSVLSTWIALEVLSPATTFKTSNDIGRSAQGTTVRLPSHLPWPAAGKAVEKSDLVYGAHTVILGTLDAGAAYKEIFETYPNEDLNIRRTTGVIPIALLNLDYQGRLSTEAAPTISSFAWGIPHVLRKDINILNNWAETEEELLERLANLLNGGAGILTQEVISAALEFLLQSLEIPVRLSRPDMFVVSYPFSPVWKDRTREPPAQKQPPPIFLNSFFLNDLIEIKKRPHRDIPFNIVRFIEGLDESTETTDFTTSKAAIQRYFQPHHIPHGRWPVGPGRGLVTMQQLAANCMLTHDDPGAPEAQNDETIVAVNGPPGTGKTTLYRDIIADLICSRAEAMAAIDDPVAAFTGTPYFFNRNGFEARITPLPPTLTGFEIVVASSNNGAVENITKELPGIKSIPEGSELRYYSHIGTKTAKTEAWGLIAAALGNMKNCTEFKDNFWYDPDWSMRQILLGADGRAKPVPDKDKNGKKIERPPHILAAENVACNPAEARLRWKEARRRFQGIKTDLVRRMAAISDLAGLMVSVPKLEAVLIDDENDITAADANLQLIQTVLDKAVEQRLSAITRRARAQERLDALKLIAPGAVKRLLQPAQARVYDRDLALAVEEFNKASRSVDQYDDSVISWQGQLASAQLKHKHAKAKLSAAQVNLRNAKDQFGKLRRALPGIPLDGDFLDANHTDFHTAIPWLDDETNRLRENLFGAAMDVHRAFGQAAAKVLLPNLGAACDILVNQRPTTDTSRIVQIAWQTLFLVCPVISTAFASVGRLFKHVPDRTFGHLLIDEAGQAAPQYAVGAIAKAKSVFIVGDPLQIEPVVTLPEAIGVQIARTYNLKAPLRYLAPRASVQTLGDRASAFKGSFEANEGVRTVGVPLVVHRRCSEPMFSIANQIAYAGAMVSLKQPQPSPIKNVLNESRWINVVGQSGTWVPEEGEIVVDMLVRLLCAEVELNLYVLAPFREVAYRLKTMIRNALSDKMPGEDLTKFLDERVGTVHTAQGKEAEAVIFVLGAGGHEAVGSRNWAGSMPNLLNVAVTRAKEALYVVGDRQGWSSVGHFSVLVKMLPAESPQKV